MRKKVIRFQEVTPLAAAVESMADPGQFLVNLAAALGVPTRYVDDWTEGNVRPQAHARHRIEDATAGLVAADEWQVEDAAATAARWERHRATCRAYYARKRAAAVDARPKERR